jgi:hypothetical protein
MQTIYLGNTLINDVMLGSERMNVKTNPLYIGAFAYGGIIISLDGTAPNYTGGIVVALNDAYTSPTFPYTIWGCSGTTIGTSAAVGSGATNTAAILAGCATRPILASLAADYVEGGYSDWVLPSEGEMDLINTYYTLIPNLSNQLYATSTEGSTVSTQWRGRFINSIATSTAKDNNSTQRAIRCVRYFTIP